MVLLRSVFFIIVLSVFLLPGCMTVRQIEKHCDTFAKVCLTESTHTDSSVTIHTEIRDTFIFVYLPGEIVIDSIPFKVPIPVEVYRTITPTSITAETEYAFAKAWITENGLYIELSTKDTLLHIKLNDAIKETTILKNKLIQKDQIIKSYQAKKFMRSALQLIIAFSMVIAALIFLFKFKRP
jgi:hypothetical protein